MTTLRHNAGPVTTAEQPVKGLGAAFCQVDRPAPVELDRR